MKRLFPFVATWACLAAVTFTAKRTHAQVESCSVVHAEDGIWRRPEADGLNCLFVLMQLYGVAVSYQELQATFELHKSPEHPAAISLLDLRNIASQYGLRVDLVRSSPGEELYDLLPAVTLLSSPRNGRGEYALLFETCVASDEVQIMHGGFVWLGRLSQDRFRRDWSGIVLTAAEHDSTNWFATASWIGASLTFAITYLWWRLRAN